MDKENLDKYVERCKWTEKDQAKFREDMEKWAPLAASQVWALLQICAGQANTSQLSHQLASWKEISLREARKQVKKGLYVLEKLGKLGLDLKNNPTLFSLMNNGEEDERESQASTLKTNRKKKPNLKLVYSKKEAPSQEASHAPKSHDIPLGEPSEDELRDLFEGIWASSMPPFDADYADLLEDVFEQRKYAFIQTVEDPYRFVGYLLDDELEGNLDIRILPALLQEDKGLMFFFTTLEEDEFEDVFKSGFAVLTTSDNVQGLLMEHMGVDVPIYWRRTEKGVPYHLKKELEEQDPFEQMLQQFISPSFQGGSNFVHQSIGKRSQIVALNDLDRMFVHHPGIVKILRKAGINDMKKLQSLSDQDLLSLSGVGPVRLQTIRDCLQTFEIETRQGRKKVCTEKELNQIYTIHVQLDCYAGVWREFELLGSHTLEDLHCVIQDAFQWDNEHLYAFFMSGVFWDEQSAITHSKSEGFPDAANTKLATLELKPKQTFVYTFDFGDEIRHKLMVRSICEVAEHLDPLRFPRITKSEGDAPEQNEARDDGPYE